MARIESPAWFTVDRETFVAMSEALPPAQVGKLLVAMATFFFTGEEADYKLPGNVQAMFNMKKSELMKKRQAALNQMRNRKYSQVPDTVIEYNPHPDEEEA